MIATAQTKVTLEGGALAVRFPYSPVKVERISSLKIGAWDDKAKVWHIPPHMLDVMRPLFPDLHVDPAVEQLLAEHRQLKEASKATDAEWHIAGLGGTLMPFQRAGAKFVGMRSGRAIIGDQMGLGKTVQASAWLQAHPELRPALIVCPASLKINWQRHIEEWVTLRNTTAVLNGTKAGKLPQADVYIANYDIAKYWQTALLGAGLRCLVCDEAHYLKSQSSQRTKAVKALADVDSVILLTGTPLLNRPAELWPLLNIIDPDAWSNWMGYARRYCDAKLKEITIRGGKKRKVWDFSGAKNQMELHDAVSRYMVRRLKADVLKDLPPKRRVAVPMEIPPAARWEYDKLRGELRRAIEQAKESGESIGAVILPMMEQLKQLTAQAKLPQAIEWIGDFIEAEKLILFATHKFVVAELLAAFGDKAVAITGDTPQAARMGIVDRFQKDDNVRLFVGNIDAAGVGLTLTAASNVAFLELDWTPAKHEQAEDRAHRIGQVNSVTAWYLLAEDSIDQEIFKALERKRLVTQTITDGIPQKSLHFDVDVIEEVAQLILES